MEKNENTSVNKVELWRSNKKPQNGCCSNV